MGFVKKSLARLKLRGLKRDFEKGDYIQAYARSTDLKVSIDPRAAIGGMWEEMGLKQFEFLKSRGLEPNHKLLDIGCGTLRAGLHFIEYLDPGNYSGFDISENAIRHGRELIRNKGQESKRPNLTVNETGRLTFSDYEGQQFDYLLAQSVFSHLKPAHIGECFANLRRVMSDSGEFIFTFHPGDKMQQRNDINFEYPPAFFSDLAEKHGFFLEDMSEDFQHPRKQRVYICTQ
jgi:cyclopropane fatty-acyl-phospholipid synthase-like methyltransferase